MLNKIFAIYNYSINIKESDILENEVMSPIKDNFAIKRAADRHALDLSFCITGSGGYFTSYYITHTICRKSLKKDDLNFIGNNCLKALKIFGNSYKVVSPSVIIGVIDKTIETCIVSIMLGKAQPSSSPDGLVNGVSSILHRLNKWANRTYEGRKIPFSFIIDLNELPQSKHSLDSVSEFLQDDASALLTDGISSYITIGKSLTYHVVNYYDPEQPDKRLPLVPYRFSSFGYMCNAQKLGLILTVQGDILFIKQRKLTYAKRNGDWHFYDYDSFNEILFHDMPEIKTQQPNADIKIKKIYITCLDVAFARTGGCLAICKDENIAEIKKCVQPADLHAPHAPLQQSDKHEKRFFLEKVVVNDNSFDTLCRKARQELLGIDGATVISTDGRFVTTGAIMDNNIDISDTDVHGGARTKIAVKLSQYGIAIKISADGYIECYKNHVHIY